MQELQAYDTVYNSSHMIMTVQKSLLVCFCLPVGYFQTAHNQNIDQLYIPA